MKMLTKLKKNIWDKVRKIYSSKCLHYKTRKRTNNLLNDATQKGKSKN